MIIPDFTWIRDRLDKVDAIVLTHGHEDHIGGVPYLLRERPDIPVVGSRLTLALLESKLAEHRITPRTVEVAEERPAHVRLVRLRVRRRQPLHPRRARRRHPHVGRAGAAHRRLQDGPVPARRPGHRPARLRPPGRGGRRPLPRRLHQRRGPRLHRLRGASSRRRSTPSSAPPPAGSSCRASPATCTASSRSSMPPSGTAARSRSWGARWCATWASPASWATSPSPTASSSRTSRPWSGCAPTRWRSSPPGHRASRWRPWPGWPTATTR